MQFIFDDIIKLGSCKYVIYNLYLSTIYYNVDLCQNYSDYLLYNKGHLRSKIDNVNDDDFLFSNCVCGNPILGVVLVVDLCSEKSCLNTAVSRESAICNGFCCFGWAVSFLLPNPVGYCYKTSKAGRQVNYG